MAVLLLLVILSAAWTVAQILTSPRHCPAHVPGVACDHVCDLPPGAHRHHCPRCDGEWQTIRIGGEEPSA